MIKKRKMRILSLMRVARKIFLIISIFSISLVIIACGYYLGVTHDATLNPEKLLFNEKSILIYDQNGDVVQNTNGSILKESISIKEIPQSLKDAFVCTEDKRFYKHGGYDFKRILRASANNIKAHTFKEGASTISQQLIKNTHLTQEKTLKRKLREWKLTKALEKNYTKDEILERYLNTIYFGHNCFGIASASQFYFGKHPYKLALDEAALLAGLVKSPNNYSPIKNPDLCKKRRQIVLTMMYNMGKITKKEKDEANDAPLPENITRPQNGGYMHFVFDELTDLSEKYNFTLGGKIEIRTFLNQALQAETEKIANSYTESDKAFFVLDKETNGFKACVSSVGNIPRLPGSIIKPLLVYAPAIEENLISPATPILDAKINYSGYAPENYNGVYHGYISVRECVEKSLNVPAVKILDTLTVDKGVAYLQKLGLSVYDEDKTLALALGGMKKGFTLSDVLCAYHTLQNDGVFNPCGFISSIKINGATVYKKSNDEKRVFSTETASLITDILKGTAQNGTAKKLRSLPFEIAAKTGTVGSSKGNTDAYAISYTTRDCAGVWLGNANNEKINHTGGGKPCELLREINESIYKLYEREQQSIPPFKLDKNVKKIALDKCAYYDMHTLLLADDNAPLEGQFNELFKTSAIPLNKSTAYTCPTINTPTVSIKNKVVTITFNDTFPKYYTYKIERYDYVSHTTLYQGEYIPFFSDESLCDDKNYVYIVTPIYNGKEGEPTVLPTISTRNSEKAELNQEILSKEWWQY